MNIRLHSADNKHTRDEKFFGYALPCCEVYGSFDLALNERSMPDSVDYSTALTQLVKRADPSDLREIFGRYASITDYKNGGKFMTPEDFVRKYLGLCMEENFNKEAVKLIASAADTSKDGLISFDEFQAFENILRSPDALYQTAFEIFDTNASKTVTFDEFQRIIRLTQPVIEANFDFDCQFIKSYFGADKKRAITYFDFCQLLHDFYEEQGVQAFKKFDKSNLGFIKANNFQEIMTTVKSHMLTTFVRENLISATSLSGAGASDVTFPYYLAFNSLLAKLELFKRIYLLIAKGNLQIEIAKEEYLYAAQPYAQVTPLEVEILFRLANLAHPSRKTMNFKDLENIDPEHLKHVSYVRRLTNVKAVKNPSERGIGTHLLESMYRGVSDEYFLAIRSFSNRFRSSTTNSIDTTIIHNHVIVKFFFRFSMGAMAGACGATAVYPIDLVKTRMQNQRNMTMVGEVMYKNSWDCFRKVIRHEGFVGLYRGLVPQLLGVAPEKAIKLATNDFVRDRFTRQGKIPLWAEILAGSCGGASQVMFTNPVEIVKIRLQTAGEIQAGPRVSLSTIFKDLGLFGLYKGSKACFLRDIPFSAIYFPVYAHAKTWTADVNGHNNLPSLFISAFIAGVPAAGLVTPADVIKTRLQVAARAGQTTYDGLVDCYRKILREEGWKAFWKGTAARVFRSSPQFGVTLMVYELLQRVFYVDFGGNRPAGSEVAVPTTLTDHLSHNPDHAGGYRLAAATFAGVQHKFGLFFPKFEVEASNSQLRSADKS
uniref:EF-hand domain-containing protein n=1 Tax=Romanomermis culicivorax TaxID=13658 RepID=A0A915I026_ROMCU